MKRMTCLVNDEELHEFINPKGLEVVHADDCKYCWKVDNE